MLSGSPSLSRAGPQNPWKAVWSRLPRRRSPRHFHAHVSEVVFRRGRGQLLWGQGPEIQLPKKPTKL